MTDTTDKLIVQSESRGVQQTTDQIKGYETALGGVQKQSEQTERSTVSMENKFKGLERQFGTTEGRASQFAKIQDTVNKAVAQNPGLQDRANQILAAAEARYIGAGKAADVAAKSTGLAGYQLVNLSRQLQDVGVSLASGQSPLTVMVQQGSQIADVFSTGNVTAKGFFEQIAAGAARVFTPMRLAVGGVLGFGAAALYVGASWHEAQTEIDRALIGIGQRSGSTSADIVKFARDNATAAGLSVGQTRDIGIEFARTGNIAVGSLKGIGDAIYGYTILTGKSASDATKIFAEAFSGDLVEGAKKLDSVYGSLDASTLNYIRTLQSQGDRMRAIQVIIDAQENDNRKAAESVGFLTQAWNALGNAIAFVTKLPVGNLDPNQKLAQAKQNQQSGSPQLGNNPGGYGLLNTGSLYGASSSIDALQKKADEFNADNMVKEFNKLSTQSDSVVRSLTPQIAAIEKLEEAKKQLERSQPEDATADSESGRALAAIDSQIASLRGAQDEAARYNERVNVISSSWGDVSQSTALALQAAQNQLPVIEAVGGGAKMAAQYAADYANAIDQGKTATEAAALAGSRLQASQAQVNSQAREQLAALQSQYAVSAARNVQEQIAAQGQATFNALIREGVDEELAMAVASQQVANAKAKAYENAEKMVRASENQLALAKASGTADEARVRAAIAYENAIEAGASKVQAGAIATNTWLASTIQLQKAAEQVAEQWERAERAASQGSFSDPINWGFSTPGAKQYTSGGASNVGYVPGVGYVTIQEYNAWKAGTLVVDPTPVYDGGFWHGKLMPKPSSSSVADSALQSGGIDAAISYAQSYGGTTDQISTVQSLYEIKNSQTSNKGQQIANYQAELAWLQSQPASIAQQQAIMNLKKSIDALKNSTDTLNGTNQDLLSPYYSQDPRTSHIGFRSQGMSVASADYFNSLPPIGMNDNVMHVAPIPGVATTPARGGGMSVTINMPVTIQGTANRDEVGRTMYQAAQTAAKQLAAASR